MIKTLFLALLLTLSTANAAQFTWTGNNNDGSGEDARVAFNAAASQVVTNPKHVKTQSFENDIIWQSGDQTVSHKGVTWSMPNGIVTGAPAVVRIKGKDVFVGHSNLPELKHNMIGFDVQTNNLNNKMYGACTSHRPSASNTELHFFLDGIRQVDFPTHSTKIWNSDPQPGEYYHPIFTICFIDTEGFQLLEVRNYEGTLIEDNISIWTTDNVQIIGPINYSPDFSVLGAIDPADPVDTGECPPNTILDHEGECQDDPNYVEPENG